MGVLMILTILALVWVVSCINPGMAPSADWEGVRRWVEEEARYRLQQYEAEHLARVELYGGTFFSDGYKGYKEGLRREAARKRWEGLFKDEDRSRVAVGGQGLVVEDGAERALVELLPPVNRWN